MAVRRGHTSLAASHMNRDAITWPGAILSSQTDCATSATASIVPPHGNEFPAPNTWRSSRLRDQSVIRKNVLLHLVRHKQAVNNMLDIVHTLW